MYSALNIAKKYLHYLATASNGKGHGVHSPFVFDFINRVLRDRQSYEWYEKIEKVRNELLNNRAAIEVEDHGAGSSMIASGKKVIKDIAQSSLKNKKFGQLFFRIAKYCKPATIIELGTSFGISASYFAAGSPRSKVYTLEGSDTIAHIASGTFESLNLRNIELIRGNFDATLPRLLKKIETVHLAFIDGNHRKKPTLEYFNVLLRYSGEHTVLIFDDIHWSAEMEEAWQEIQRHAAVTLTIDLFFVGVLFFKKDFKAKQHFAIRF